MANLFHFFPLLRVFCFAVVTSYIADSISNNISMKCYRRTYPAVQWLEQCDAREGNDWTKTGDKLLHLQEAKQEIRLPRIDPVKVGFIREVEHDADGKIYKLKTLSVRPPIFEIQGFLSSEECHVIVEMAKSTGMAASETVWSEYDEVLTEGNLRAVFERLDVNTDDSLDYFELSDGVRGIRDISVDMDDLKEMFKKFGFEFFDDEKITFSEFEIITSPEIFEQIKSYLGQLEGRKSSVKSRQSFSAFLDPSIDEYRRAFFEKLHRRISKVTQLSIEMIRSSEALQVIKYEVGGHYHVHIDSESSEYAPCCHLVHGDDGLCRPCRYATMFYYLNEPTEGGGTAFPFADNVTYDDVKLSRDEKHRLNLSSHCDKANLVYMPKKGAALFWYNHVIDNATGWLGDLDEMSSHGGCDVIQGEKWAANNWLNAGNDREADLGIWKNFKDP